VGRLAGRVWLAVLSPVTSQVTLYGVIRNFKHKGLERLLLDRKQSRHPGPTGGAVTEGALRAPINSAHKRPLPLLGPYLVIEMSHNANGNTCQEVMLSKRWRTEASIARSIAVQAMASPPSSTALSAASVMQCAVNSGW